LYKLSEVSAGAAHSCYGTFDHIWIVLNELLLPKLASSASAKANVAAMDRGAEFSAVRISSRLRVSISI
jgi:hypothetical protein